MHSELKSLRIDRSQKRRQEGEPSKWATRWIVAGVAVLLLLGATSFVLGRVNSAVEVETRMVRSAASNAGAAEGSVILNATGYIVAAHKIQVASKVLGRVAWIGVDKGDKVTQGQTIVRLEDDEYRAQLQQARGNLMALQARLEELETGSRPEEIQRAAAELDESKAELQNARVNLDRTKTLVAQGVMSKQALDDAQARYDRQTARVGAVQRTYDLVKIGPRQEQIAAVRGQLEQARGMVAFYETQLANTVIKAPVTGTILERAVERGEFVTTSFVGERGAKGYVVSLADLSDLEVELDISQNDFARLGPRQKGIVTTDAYPDRKYDGVIDEISPEANRQKATVQVKVKILSPDDYLRPEMNASVAFVAEGKPGPAAAAAPGKRIVYVPASAIREDKVFIVLDGKAVVRTVKTAGSTAQGIRVEGGLNGGEELILNPPADLKEGTKVRARQS
jgi:HlyD family secretion protein